MNFAMIFPGQGSQSVGMLQEMAETSSIVTETFAEASEVLNYDLWRLTCYGPAEELGLTQVTQPALLTASVALWRVWCERTDLRPHAMAGHSLGEYSALVCAGVLDFAEAVLLVAKRGALMQRAVPEGEGGMAAVLGLDDATVVALCAESAEAGVVEAVNFNAPGQVVIAGARHAVERACIAAKQAGARRAQMLSISVPGHSSLMRPAAWDFVPILANITLHPAQCRILHNVGIDQVSNIQEALARQLYNPVPWTQIVQRLVTLGTGPLLECGPGRVLCGLLRRIDKSLQGLPLETPNKMTDALAALTTPPGEEG